MSVFLQNNLDAQVQLQQQCMVMKELSWVAAYARTELPQSNCL